MKYILGRALYVPLCHFLIYPNNHSWRQWVFHLQQRSDHFQNEIRIFTNVFKDSAVLLDILNVIRCDFKLSYICSLNLTCSFPFPITARGVACLHRRIGSDCFPCAVRVEANAAWHTGGGHPVNITRVRMTRLCPLGSSSMLIGHRCTER